MARIGRLKTENGGFSISPPQSFSGTFALPLAARRRYGNGNPAKSVKEHAGRFHVLIARRAAVAADGQPVTGTVTGGAGANGSVSDECARSRAPLGANPLTVLLFVMLRAATSDAVTS